MENVCRTCLRVIESTYSITYLYGSKKSSEAVSIRQKLQACVPELTLDIVADPAICSTCTSALTFAFQFRSTCLQTEKTLYKCIQSRRKHNPNFTDLLSTNDLLQIARKGIQDEHSYSYAERYSPVDNSCDESSSDQETQSVSLSNRVQSSLGEIVKKVNTAEKKRNSGDKKVNTAVKKVKPVNEPSFNIKTSPKKYTNKNKVKTSPKSKNLPAPSSTINFEHITIKPDFPSESVKKVSSLPLSKSIDKLIKKLKDHADHDCGTIVNTDLGVLSANSPKSKVRKMPKIRAATNKRERDEPLEDASKKRQKLSLGTRQINIKRTCRGQKSPNRATNTNEKVVTKKEASTDESNDSEGSVGNFNVTAYVKPESSFRYQCNRCNKGYKFKSHFDVHLKSHIIKKLFSCPICNKDFTQEKYLKTHAMLHTNTGLYQCDLCSKYLSSSTALKRHIVTHTGEKAFACTHCNKRFAQRVQCTVHMRTHTGDRPFLCHVCKSTFTQKSHLMGHMLTHTGEKPFKCDVCPKQFRKINALNIHKQSHSKKPFQCRSCSFLFRDGETLRRHIGKHLSGRLPMKNKLVINKKSKQILIDKLKDDIRKMGFIKRELVGNGSSNKGVVYCDVCLRSFSSTFHLGRHMRIHN